jgi:hypothetical protein
MPVTRDFGSSCTGTADKNLEIYESDFICKAGGGLTLFELDEELAKADQISNLMAPKHYSLSRILSEKWGQECERSVLGLELLHADGSKTKTGGKVIKNVSGYDLNNIYVGSCNALAIIDSAYLRTYKLSECELNLEYRLDLTRLQYEPKFFDFGKDYSVTITNLSQASCFGSGQESATTNIFKVYTHGSQDLLEQRRSKITERISASLAGAAELKNTKLRPYQKKYPDIEGKIFINLYTVSSRLLSLYLYLQESAHQSKTELRADFNQNYISYIIPLNDDFTNSIEHLTTILENNSLFGDIKVFPITYFSQNLQRHLHSATQLEHNSNKQHELKLLRELKRTLDPENLLNPGVLA